MLNNVVARPGLQEEDQLVLMPRRRIFAAGTAVAALAAMASPAVFPGRATAASATLVVNEVYGGSGNSGATLKNDFIELANAGASATSVDGWSVQYEPSSGTSAWQVTPLTQTSSI